MKGLRDRAPPAAVLYLQLPARAEVHQSPNALQQVAFPFALVVRGRLREQGSARMEALSDTLRRSQRVVLLFSASDVTVMRVTVPPLPAHRLMQALPALVEERLIGDPTACVLASGPSNDSLRTIAVIDRAWLDQWVSRARRLGAKRLSALPLQLCLPSPTAAQAVAWVIDFSQATQGSRELVIRTAHSQAVGLPLGAIEGSEAASPAGTLDAAMAMTGGSSLTLFVPQTALPAFGEELMTRQTASSDGPMPAVELRPTSWETLIEGAAGAQIDLLSGMIAEDKTSFDWKRWRLPLALALALLLLNVLALNGDWWRLHQEGARLASDSLRVYRHAFPDDRADDQTILADPLVRMTQQVHLQRLAAGEPSPSDFLWLSAALGDAWPAIQQATGLDARAVASIEYRNASLLLRFKPGSQPSLATAQRTLADRQLEVMAGDEPDSWRVKSAQ